MLKTRVDGLWVETSQSGYYRASGDWVEFGAPPAPSYETLTWPNSTPAITDAFDTGTEYNMGVRFSLVSPKPCYGVQWRCPDTTPLPLGNPHVASLWDIGTEERLEWKEFTPTPGQYQDILFDDPYNLPSVSQFVVAIYTFHYVFRGSTTYPITSPSSNVVADVARLSVDGGPLLFPNGSSATSNYYVAPIVGV